MRNRRALLRVLLAAAMIASSPGFWSYEAAAGVIRNSGRGRATVVPVPTHGPAAALAPLGAGPLSLITIPAASASASPAAAIPPAVRAASPASPIALKDQLEAGVSRVEAAPSQGARATALNELFERPARTSGDSAAITAGADSRGPSTLSRPASAARPSKRRSKPAASSPSPKRPSSLRWLLPILGITALAYGLDMGTKLAADELGFAFFHESAWRKPLLAVVAPLILYTAYKARSSFPHTRRVWEWSPKQIRNGRLGFYRTEISGINEMRQAHPSLRWALRLYDVAIGLMLGGLLGNTIDVFRFGGALDWIPLGRSLLNLADVTLLAGLAYFQLASSFFIKAGKAHHSKKLLHFSTVGFLGLPILGFFVAWTFGSSPSDEILNLVLRNIAFVYLMGFSMLLGISRLFAAIVVNRFASRFSDEEEKK